ncbi:unnamed protein product [Owenia fusiformis]|uniref:Glutathione peroxidase n=1 Tax=Owenia fusiformis TaxID=6347 RepID=A0A8S4N111_OWEFU|nr:unnamed protein product [Owenia fusiformis]
MVQTQNTWRTLTLIVLMDHLSFVIPNATDDVDIEEEIHDKYVILENDIDNQIQNIVEEKDQKNLVDCYSFTVDDISGETISLEKYRGMISLIVNVASECGYTDNHYKGLVKAKQAFGSKFTVLAFPCNQFGAQEPKGNNGILQFAQGVYGANFPMFAKINVLEPDVSPVWQFLAETSGHAPNWNFWKYLVDGDGHVLNAYGPWVSVEDMWQDITFAVHKLNNADKPYDHSEL